MIFWHKWSKKLFSHKYWHFLFQLCNQYAFRNFLRCITSYMSVGQKLAMFKISSNSVTLLSLCDLEAAAEEAMQLRRLIKSSNESLEPFLESSRRQKFCQADKPPMHCNVNKQVLLFDILEFEILSWFFFKDMYLDL